MKSWKWKLIVSGPLLVSLLVLIVAHPGAVPQRNSGENKTPRYGDTVDPYEVVPNWPQPLYPDGSLTWGRVGAVYAESPNRVYLFQTGMLPPAWLNEKDPDAPNFPRRGSQSAGNCAASGNSVPGNDTAMCYKGKPIPGARWEHVVMVVDANGKLVESWEQHNKLFWHPHGINMDPNDPEHHVWVTDDNKEQIYKFTHDGKKLVMTVGDFREGGSGAHGKGLHKSADQSHLGGPNGIAFLPNGDFLVSDGYQNSRVVKFSKDGKFLMDFGKKGNKPGEFNTTHSVEVDANGKIYVGDRGNFRIQIFDKDGKYLSEINGVYPNALAVSKDQRYLYVSQGGANAAPEIRTYDLPGIKLLRSWGRPYGAHLDQLWSTHDFSLDSEGNLYFAQAYGGGAWKYRLKKGADPIFSPFQKNSF